MANVTYIRVGNSIVLKTFANYTDLKNSTDLVLLLDNMGDSHVKSSISIALTIAACAFLLSCYSCCCFDRFSGWSRTQRERSRSRLMSASFSDQIRPQITVQLDEESDDGNQGQRDRTNSPTQAEVIRRYDLDVESLPSYTLVSGLPSYDDALEQFRKAGIIIQQPSVIKIFEDVQIKSPESTDNGDNVSVHSCSCGATQTGSIMTTTTVAPVIELTPEQLKILSQKRLSLQIALNSSVRQPNRNRIDLCREVNRSNLLRSHDFPQVHRSTSSLSNERNFTHRLAYLQHRGSLA